MNILVVGISDIPAEIPTSHLPIASLELYWYVSLIGENFDHVRKGNEDSKKNGRKKNEMLLGNSKMKWNKNLKLSLNWHIYIRRFPSSSFGLKSVFREISLLPLSGKKDKVYTFVSITSN
jgi:hypothetical protein